MSFCFSVSSSWTFISWWLWGRDCCGLSHPPKTHTHKTHRLCVSQSSALSVSVCSSVHQSKNIMSRSVLNIFIFLLLCRSCDSSRKLLLFLIDGLRYDYTDDLQNLEGFREIVENGVKVDYMTPDFPSLSYPNYYSLMTGKTCQQTLSVPIIFYWCVNIKKSR